MRKCITCTFYKLILEFLLVKNPCIRLDRNVTRRHENTTIGKWSLIHTRSKCFFVFLWKIKMLYERRFFHTKINIHFLYYRIFLTNWNVFTHDTWIDLANFWHFLFDFVIYGSILPFHITNLNFYKFVCRLIFYYIWYILPNQIKHTHYLIIYWKTIGIPNQIYCVWKKLN
jgi:hypothetical protein